MDNKENNKTTQEPSSPFDNLIKNVPNNSQAQEVKIPTPAVGGSNPSTPLPTFNQAINLSGNNEVKQQNASQSVVTGTATNSNQNSNSNNVTGKSASNQVPPTVNGPVLKKEATTIGMVKPDKQKSPLAMFFLFAILILILVFLPQINVLVDTYIMPYITGTATKTVPNVTANTTNNTTNNTTTDTTKFYDLNATTTLTVDKLSISNITKATTNNLNTISIAIKNTDSNAYTFSKKLYLEFYDKDDTFLGRALYEYATSIASNSTVNVIGYVNNDTFNNATKFEALLRTTDDYPEVSLTNDTLTCTGNNDVYIYNFKDNKLIKITDTYTYIKGNDVITYNNDLITYKQNVGKMDALNGVTGVLTETSNGFITTIVVDYTDAKYSELTTKINYYDKDTLAKVISFEMAAKNYTCK
jgi:hypothetical protein